MAIEKSLKTRLVMRNADLSAWDESTLVLQKGEMAFARLSGDQAGCYKVRIGTGDKTWSQLSDQGQLIIPAKNVEGLTEAIAALSTSYYETDDISKLSDEYVNGDIAVEKKTITGDKQEYCAYRYDTTDGEWKALDGNYSAENVYLPKNMTITYTFGRYSASASSPKTLACAGMNVQNFINDAFAETLQPTITNPSFSFGGRAGGTAEIGQKYTVNGATLTFNQGRYTYGPTPDCKAKTGVKLLRVANGTVEGAEATTTEDKGAGQILSISGSSTQVSYLSTDAIYTYQYNTGFYTTSTISANNNIGGLSDPVKCIIANGNQLTGSTTATFTGQYPSYWGFTTSPKSNPTAIAANGGNVTIDGITYTRELNAWSTTSFTTSNKWYELFYMVPACKRSSTGWTGKDSNNVDLAVGARTEATVTFADGQTAKYYVYVVRNAAQYSATTCTMKFN